MSTEWITISEAESLGVTRTFLTQWRRFGAAFVGGRKLRTKKIPRVGRQGVTRLVHRDDVDAWLKASLFTGEYQDAAGTWLSTKLVWKRFGLTHGRIDLLCKNGSPQLEGKKLRRQRLVVVEFASGSGKGSGRRSHPRLVYHAGDIATVGTGIADDELFISLDDATKETGLSKEMLRAWWRQNCIYLGRRLRSRKLHVDMSRATRNGRGKEQFARRVRMLSRDDLKKAIENYHTRPEQTHDPNWLGQKEVEARFGFSSWQLTEWSKHFCPHLGQKLTRRKSLHGGGQIARMLFKYPLGELVRIEQSLPAGRHIVGKQFVKARVVHLHADVLHNHQPSPEADTLAEYSDPQSPSDWAKLYKCCVDTFNRWARLGKIRVHRISTKSCRVHRADVPNAAQASG